MNFFAMLNGEPWLRISTLQGLNGQTISGDANGAWAVAANGTNQSISLTPSGTGLTVFVGASQTSYFGSLIGNAGYGAIYLASGAPGGTNFALASNGSDTALNGVTGNPIRFMLGGSEKARIAPSGNLLIGGLTADGTGVLQLPAATTSAGGIAFGTDTFFFRSAMGTIHLNNTVGDTALYFDNGGAAQGRLESSGGAFYVSASLGSLVLRSGSATTALVLDSSQNATFAGQIIAKQTTVGALPAAAAGNKGARLCVTDSNATLTAGIGAVVAAGGANVVPVFSDGTNWRIG